MSEEQETTEAAKRPRKLMKDLTDEGVVKITALGGNAGEVEYDFSTLPADIQTKLGPFGLSHKLGDAAAGKTGADAEDSIQKVWDGLMAGDWSVRAPATPKVSVKALVDKMSALPPEAQEQARALLASLGVDIPS
jgi:hypothetical protein